MFVRGISNVSTIKSIPDHCEETVIGIVYAEMRTRDDKLSVWKIEDADDFLDAALSIILPKNRIDEAAFLVIEEDVLKQNNITYEPEKPTKEYIIKSKAEHYNMTNICIGSAPDVLRAYKTMCTIEEEREEAQEEKYIVSWTHDQAGDYIIDACEKGKVNISELSTEMKKSIEKYKTTREMNQ